MAQAELVAEKLRDVTARASIMVVASDGKHTALDITVSIGLASSDRIKTDDSLDQLMALADEALYQAKRQGRNLVVSRRG